MVVSFEGIGKGGRWLKRWRISMGQLLKTRGRIIVDGVKWKHFVRV